MLRMCSKFQCAFIGSHGRSALRTGSPHGITTLIDHNRTSKGLNCFESYMNMMKVTIAIMIVPAAIIAPNLSLLVQERSHLLARACHTRCVLLTTADCISTLIDR